MKKTILLTALSLLLLSVIVAPVMAQYDWDVGVEVGDWFLYEGTLVYYESQTVAFPPAYLEYLQTYNDSDWIKYTVTDITPGNGAIVTFDVLTHWSDGTETTDTLEENITSSANLMVIGANLTDGTEIRPAYSLLDQWDMPARYLNASIMLDTANGTRETNVLDHDSNIFDQIYHYTYYWDKETGIQVYYEAIGDDVLNQDFQPFSFKCKLELVDSSSGIIVPDITVIVMLSTLFATAIPILIYKRKTIPR